MLAPSPLALLKTAGRALNRFSGPFVFSLALLGLRLIYGYQFFLSGRGKLLHLERTAAFFAELSIPLPGANALLVGGVEMVGGLLLMMGLAGRATGAVLALNMTVAYLTADREAVVKWIGEGDPLAFFAAAPFWFWLTALLVWANGAGWFSADALLGRCRGACPGHWPLALRRPDGASPEPDGAVGP